jgi:coenzyme Q-binding protein COQ10
MPSFISTTSKAVRSVTTRKNGIVRLIGSVKNTRQVQRLDQIRCFSGIAPSAQYSDKDLNLWSRRLFDNAHTVQTRRFLGCGDGDEGGVLSKVYEEKLVLG